MKRKYRARIDTIKTTSVTFTDKTLMDAERIRTFHARHEGIDPSRSLIIEKALKHYRKYLESREYHG